MKHRGSQESPREQEHAQLADDLRTARATRLRKAIASSDEDPRAVQEKLDALEIELHRVIDASERTFRTPAEEMRLVAKDALLEILRGTQSDLETNGSRLLRNEDWMPYVDGIVERSAKMAPAEVVSTAMFRKELLEEPEVIEVIQSLKRLSAEHARTQISGVMDEFVQELRDRVTEAAFLYKSIPEITGSIYGQLVHVTKLIGLEDERVYEEFRAWGERQATDIMLKRYQHIFDIAVRTAYEQDPNLSDPEHLREAVRYTVERESWKYFDFDTAFDGYTQSDEFFDEYRQRFLDAVPNRSLRDGIEMLLHSEEATAAIHQLAENIDIYLHAFSGQNMKQLAFLVGVLFGRLLARPHETTNTDVQSLESAHDAFARRFGTGISMKQCIEDMNTLIKWDGAFDPLVERFTTEALRPYVGRRFRIVTYDRSVPQEFDSSADFLAEKILQQRLPFLELNQVLTSAHGDVPTVTFSTGFARDMNVDILVQRGLAPENVHNYDKRQKAITEQALRDLKAGKIPKRIPRNDSRFAEYYLQQGAREIIAALKEGRALPNDQKPEEYLNALGTTLHTFGDYYYKSWLNSVDPWSHNIIFQKQKALIALLQERQERREAHGIE